ncbi:hypothetical protein NC651_009121 [Populus alba x Populus x berolinensis]|nr:hypothetical protein NC651_009121 [Populus alba x Populus x berolinensis]
MAKSMRSKREKRLRAIRRDLVQPLCDKKDEAKFAVLEAALAAPKIPVKPSPFASSSSSSAMDTTTTTTTTITTDTQIVYWPMIRLTSKTSICLKLCVEQSNLLYEANPVYYIGICFIFYSVWLYGNGRWESNREVIEADREEAKKEIEAVKKEEPWKGEDQEETYLICKH